MRNAHTCPTCGTRQRPEWVPTEVIRRAFEDSGLEASKATYLAGWLDRRGYADTGRLEKALGSRVDRGKYRQSVFYETAVHLITAWNLDPATYGV